MRLTDASGTRQTPAGDTPPLTRATVVPGATVPTGGLAARADPAAGRNARR